MKNSRPPTTSVTSYFDSFTNEWVTTFVIKHKVEPGESPKPDPLKYLNTLNNTCGDLNKLTSNLKLPTLNQKDLGIYPY